MRAWYWPSFGGMRQILGIGAEILSGPFFGPDEATVSVHALFAPAWASEAKLGSRSDFRGYRALCQP
jgi:hypothetical protein